MDKMYVDDCLVVGEPPVCQAFLTFAGDQWGEKIQGFISRDSQVSMEIGGNAEFP